MRKSELPVGSVIRIGHRLARKFQDTADTGNDWRYVELIDTVPVDYDDAHKAEWDTVLPK